MEVKYFKKYNINIVDFLNKLYCNINEKQLDTFDKNNKLFYVNESPKKKKLNIRNHYLL